MLRRRTFAAAFVALAGPAGAAQNVVLPTEWTLAPPQSTVTATKTLPQSATLTADGKHLIVVEGGAGSPGIRILNAATLATERDIAVTGAYGAPLADRSGSGFWASTAAGDAIAHYDAANGTVDRSVALPRGFWAAAIARSPDGKTLAVSGDLADAIVLVDESAGTSGAPIAVGRHPAGLAFAPDGKSVVVANWAGRTLSVVDVATHAVSEISVGLHPHDIVPSRDGTVFFVSESDDDTVGVVDPATRTRVAGINVAPYGNLLFGASPTALALSRDGNRLYVACSAANAVGVLDIAQPRAPREMGMIPTGWYPTALAVEANGTALDVVDGKGEGGRANPQFDPFSRGGDRDTSGYVASGMIGSVRRIPLPPDADLAAGTLSVLRNGGPLLAPRVLARGPAPVPAGFLSPHGPLHHVIYIIKENRTYDQVLGDLPSANGDPALALFGATVTPNEHALAKRFGILDDTFANAEVSADGHNWSVGAFADAYLERMWPQNYGGRRKQYDFEDGADASVPHSGFLWNAAARAHVSLRNYGEFTSEGSRAGDPVTSQMPDLASVTDPKFIGFDLNVRDETREAEWAREFDAYVAKGDLPQLEIVRLPNDHTAGTRAGKRTPAAYVAENDGAVGALVDHVSHSPYWRDTAIFIVEDDAQNGPDHVDAQRMTAYVVSAYAAPGVHHDHYSTAGIVHTIEAILGMPPLSAYDAGAKLLDATFVATPDLRPFDKLPPQVDLESVNTAHAYRAAAIARADLTHEDAVPDALMNDVVWHAVRGPSAALPPYGAFDTRSGPSH